MVQIISFNFITFLIGRIFILKSFDWSTQPGITRGSVGHSPKTPSMVPHVMPVILLAALTVHAHTLLEIPRSQLSFSVFFLLVAVLPCGTTAVVSTQMEQVQSELAY